MDSKGDSSSSAPPDADKKRILTGSAKEDLYAILGLQDLRWAATQEELKKQYRKLALVYHPDVSAFVGDFAAVLLRIFLLLFVC
jgi:hypothetical protein